jgi:acetyl-CoA carboxylase biotin carboxyl carrier protein
MSEKNFDGFNVDAVRALADVVCEKDLGEITVTSGNCTITVKAKKCPPPMMPPMPPMMAGSAPVSAPLAAAPAQPQATAPTETELPAGNIVKAPLVGTFYAAASPDEPPYVKVGDSVKKGDVLMIIESMKLMNEVTSDFDGVVEEIYVANGDPVEYDQPLLRIR